MIGGRHGSPLVAVAVASAITAGILLVQGGAQASVQQSAPSPAAEALIRRGRALYLPGCSSCHGVNGRGVRTSDGSERGPSLLRSGAAGAYYYLHTGRMPLANSEDEPKRKEPAYRDPEIRALVAYVASLGRGPAVPNVRTSQGDLAEGGQLFRGNCAACHSASGAGGALNYGRAAPSLAKAEPREVGSAIRIGPGQMPRFDNKTFNAQQVDSIARYVEYLHDPADPGGLALGRIGPIPEGFLIWVFGIGLLLITVAWIGKRNTGGLGVEQTGEDGQ